jgi:hypothetical protein
MKMMSAPVELPQGWPPADRRLRVIVRACDLAVVWVLAWSLMGAFGVYSMLVVSFGWEAVCTAIFGGTPLKLATGLRVVQRRDGRRIGWAASLLRWALAGAVVAVPLGVVSVIGVLVMYAVSVVLIAVRPAREALWDLVAGTVAVTQKDVRSPDSSRFWIHIGGGP